MLETLRLLRKEIDSLRFLVRNGSNHLLANGPLVSRIQDLAYTWLGTVSPQLAAIGIPPGILGRADQVSSDLAKLTAHSANKRQYLAKLTVLRLVLTRQILLEVARLPLAVQLTPSMAGPHSILPEIPDLPSELIPNSLVGWTPKIRAFLSSHSFDRNVFVMVSYKSNLAILLSRIKRALIALNLEPIVAKDCEITDDLYNPIACLLCCNYGIAIFDRAETRQTHNPNVVYELGMMQILKRRCLILKHQGLKRMPSDLLSKLYESYNSEDDAVKRINQWWSRHTSH